MMATKMTTTQPAIQAQLMTTPTEKMLFFPFGLPGFEQLHQFNLKAIPGADNFFRLQAQSEPEVALIVMDARWLGIYAQQPIPPAELKKVEIQSPDQLAILVVVKVDRENQQLRVNTKAPIIINLHRKKGIQVILDEANLSTEFPLFQEN